MISDTPPPGSAKETQTLGAKPPYVSEMPEKKAAETPKTMAEKDMEFKKRQQEAKEKAEKDAKAKAAAAEKRDNCARARSNLAALESNQQVGTFDANGQRQIMDTGMRQQEITRARAVIADSCQ